jgi:hypothetical protein
MNPETKRKIRRNRHNHKLDFCLAAGSFLLTLVLLVGFVR